MKKKKYLQGVTFFISTNMYCDLKKIPDQREISMSELLRELIGDYLTNVTTQHITSQDELREQNKSGEEIR